MSCLLCERWKIIAENAQANTQEAFNISDKYQYLGTPQEIKAKLDRLAELEKQIHDNPQPLTLEQLRERVGKPVWCSKNKQYGLIYTVSDEYYGIKFIDTCDTLKYFMTKPIYDRDPKENENG